jgi:ribosome biogenesis protein ERB1
MLKRKLSLSDEKSRSGENKNSVDDSLANLEVEEAESGDEVSQKEHESDGSLSESQDNADSNDFLVRDDVSGISNVSDENETLQRGNEGGGEETKPNRQVEKSDSGSDLYYDSEDSENERILNTIGNVPLEWYDDFEHIGYDLEGNKIVKPKSGTDQIDEFVSKNEDPTAWRILWDERHGRRVFVSDRDMEIIKQIHRGTVSEKYDPENWFIQLTDHTDTIHPVSNKPEPKTRFIPSRWEAKRIRRLVYAIRKGWIKLEKEKKKEPQFYLIWDEPTPEATKRRQHIPPPKMKLPGHAESYNPPEEYLFDRSELEAWKLMDPEDRPLNFVPHKYERLRYVPGYKNFQRERFERLLDLYLATRVQHKKVQIDPKSLLPKLPRPEELRPFPTTETIIYTGHSGHVRKITVDPTGQWLVSGSDDCTVRLWEVMTGRCMRVWTVPSAVYGLEWNPNTNLFCFAVATEYEVAIISPEFGSEEQKANTDAIFANDSENLSDNMKKLVEWKKPTPEEWKDGYRLIIYYKEERLSLQQLTFHHKGDYLATVSPDANTSAVLIHHLSKRQTQAPFKKNKGQVQCVKFHPSRPFFFVATKQHVRVYNLVQQQLTKKLAPSVQWISNIDIHPGGDNVLLGSYDKRVVWFDLDLGTKPWKTLRYHTEAVRNVVYHKKFPLFASCSDDGNVHIFHGMVYNDLLQNPLIVPLKILRAHQLVQHKKKKQKDSESEENASLGVLDCVFHPTQAWIFSSGADNTIRLFT